MMRGNSPMEPSDITLTLGQRMAMACFDSLTADTPFQSWMWQVHRCLRDREVQAEMIAKQINFIQDENLLPYRCDVFLVDGLPMCPLSRSCNWMDIALSLARRQGLEDPAFRLDLCSCPLAPTAPSSQARERMARELVPLLNSLLDAEQLGMSSEQHQGATSKPARRL